MSPTVLVSGAGDPVKPVEGFVVGACCFMTKPLGPELLAAEIRKTIRSAARAGTEPA
jgi:DNA-binding response OmpR family regulator